MSGLTRGATSTVEIKICGITRVEDALAAIDLGAAMLGLNFYPLSPRCIALEQAQPIACAVSGRVKLVGVFVNMNVSEVLRIARAVPLDAVQLHGDESPHDCALAAREFEVIRAIKADAEVFTQPAFAQPAFTQPAFTQERFTQERPAEFACCRGLLIDTPSPAHGGSGESFCWARVPWASLRLAFPAVKVFLAGGLHAGNVAAAIAAAHPDVVDVCSGVESAKGIKSVSRMREFVAAVRTAERTQQ